MLKLIMYRGLPASGKTIAAKDFILSQPKGSWVRVNKDDLRAMCHASVWTKKNEEMILTFRDGLISGALNAGTNVISDDTNFHPKHEVRLRELADTYSAEFEIKDFEADVYDCIERDAKRANGVGKDVIWKMWKESVIPKIEWPEDRTSLRPCVLVDLDGTLAEITGRNPYDASTCENDLFNKDVWAAIRGFDQDCDTFPELIFVSGRSDEYREQTERWLMSQPEIRAWGKLLFMRAKGDNRKDWLVKYEILRDKIAKQYNPIAVFDDRDQVVAMWRAQGLRVFQVADGNF